MFGNLSNGQSSGLFGNVSDANPSAKRNMFGTLSTGSQADQSNKTSGNVSVDELPAKRNIFSSLSNGTQSQQTNNMAGNGSAAEPPAKRNLFGTLSTGQQPAQNNMLAPSSNTSTTSQPTASAFGSNQSASSSLFPSLTQPSQPAPSTNSFLFGSLSKPTQNQASSSINSSSNPGAFTNETFASSNNVFASSQAQSTAYFDSILDKSRKRINIEPSSGDLPQLQLGIGDLQQRVKRLVTGVGPDRNAEAHYLLAASGIKPGEAIRDLNKLATVAGYTDRPATQEIPATDIETYLTNLQTQTTLSMIQDGLAKSIRDFDNFLEDNVIMEWDEQRKRIYEHFGIRSKDATTPGTSGENIKDQKGGFGRTKRTKATSLAGSRMRSRDSLLGRSYLQKSVIGAPNPIGSANYPAFPDVEKLMEINNIVSVGPHDRLQREKQSKYAEKVSALNFARLHKFPYPICTEFKSVAFVSGDTHGQDLVKAYRTLIEIVAEDPEITSLADPRCSKERQFASAYLDSDDVKKSINLKKAITRGGSRCLEKLAFENMEDMISKNPREANLGGIPNVINKIKAYVRLQAAQRNLAGDNTDLQILGDDYVWALIYFLLRTGHVQEANDYVRSNAAAFRAIDRNFGSYIHAYATDNDRRLSGDLQIRINNEYNQRLRIAPENSIDPYRMACYKIIGRCDLKQRHLDNIPQSVEDFAWVQVVLAREINRVDAVASEIYGLAEAQSMIKEIGHRFFSKGGSEIGSSFGAFVFLQMTVGLFENAVSYLYSYNYIDGVHLAIALDFYGLLRVSDPVVGEENLLSSTTRGQPQINFGPMIALYTRDFRAANALAAVDYIVLITLNKDISDVFGRNQRAFCHEALRELVLESREFADLLGDMRSDGQRIKGIIEQRTELIGIDEPGDFFRTITLQAASQADDNGRVTDAVLLYHLAEEYDNVILTLNRVLAQVICVPLGQPYEKLDPVKQRNTPVVSSQQMTFSLSASDDPMEMAKTILIIYGANRMFVQKVNPINLDACGKLLSIQKAKTYVEKGQWSLALDVINSLAIIPLSANGDASIIRALANAFNSLPQPLATTVPNLLLWSILCSNKQRESLAASAYGGNEGTRLEMTEQLRQINMDLMTFVGQLRYRLPASLHEALASRVKNDLI
ncbi:Nucleoporin [Erysiphe necator]|uniref:Putative nucleoporin-interacting protein nic96 n=1 Tax=Uncinula necator TaxID=52586 RepID=A0A0B1PGE6_UNCNE|nr:Nucleoporin [Erysiphe necator]KHJ35946.1 putative nucleoporin-interacting protein nic96 [Erysiphe necator]